MPEDSASRYGDRMTSSTRLPAAPQLDLSSKKGRYGVTYLDALVTASGYDMSETRPGADLLASDMTVTFPEGAVRIQVKTTSRYALAATNERLTYTAKQHWVDGWSVAMCPVYFVVVVVPDISDWVEHAIDGTRMVDTAAFWSRVDPTSFSPQNMAVAALRSQRVDAAALLQWQQDLIDGYSA